jgi:hypothetical protein
VGDERANFDVGDALKRDERIKLADTSSAITQPALKRSIAGVHCSSSNDAKDAAAAGGGARNRGARGGGAWESEGVWDERGDGGDDDEESDENAELGGAPLSIVEGALRCSAVKKRSGAR